MNLASFRATQIRAPSRRGFVWVGCLIIAYPATCRERSFRENADSYQIARCITCFITQADDCQPLRIRKEVCSGYAAVLPSGGFWRVLRVAQPALQSPCTRFQQSLAPGDHPARNAAPADQAGNSEEARETTHKRNWVRFGKTANSGFLSGRMSDLLAWSGAVKVMQTPRYSFRRKPVGLEASAVVPCVFGLPPLCDNA